MDELFTTASGERYVHIDAVQPFIEFALGIHRDRTEGSERRSNVLLGLRTDAHLLLRDSIGWRVLAELEGGVE